MMANAQIDNGGSRLVSHRPGLFAGLILLGLLALLGFGNAALAADGAEFAAAALKFETWIGGNLGKVAALVALMVGSVVAAFKKDWTWFMGALFLSVGVGIIVGVINASFTAVI